MAVTINADTTNGLVLTSDTSGEIKLQSAGANIVSVTANGMAVDTNTLYVDATNNRVGIGESNPIAELHITDSVANAVIRLESSDTGQGTINFDDQSAANQGRFLYDHSNNSMQFYTVNTERMRIDDNGDVSINGFYGTDPVSSTSTGEGFYFSGDSSRYAVFARAAASSNLYLLKTDGVTGILAQFGANGTTTGSITTSSSATAYNTSSDYRLKENVVPMSGSIDRIKQLKPSTWSWTQNGSHGEGFLAHEAQTVVPEAVSGTHNEVDDDGNPVYQGIDQSKLVPLLTAALQEAITKIEDLETRIQTLENA